MACVGCHPHLRMLSTSAHLHTYVAPQLQRTPAGRVQACCRTRPAARAGAPARLCGFHQRRTARRAARRMHPTSTEGYLAAHTSPMTAPSSMPVCHTVLTIKLPCRGVSCGSFVADCRTFQTRRSRHCIQGPHSAGVPCSSAAAMPALWPLRRVPAPEPAVRSAADREAGTGRVCRHGCRHRYSIRTEAV